MIAAQYGLGTRDNELNELMKAQAALMMGNWQMFYAASTVLVKAGIAITLLRLATQRKYRVPIITALVTTPIFTVVVVLLLIVTCRPVGAQWDLSLGPCPLHNWLAVLSYPFTALTILLDWSCAVIPWLLIRKLQLNQRIKRSLILVLGLGGIASIGAIARLPYIKYYTITEDQLCEYFDKHPPARRISHANLESTTADHTANIVLWSVFENGIGIIAASLPPIHKLFKYYDDSQTGSPKQSGGGAVETIGGTPLSQPNGTYQLSPLASRTLTTKVSSQRRGAWDRLRDEECGGDGVMVHKSFFVIEENGH